MATTSLIIQQVLQELQPSPTVSDAFQSASQAISSSVGPRAADRWATGGAKVYRSGPHSWEAALEYFKVSPDLAAALGRRSFLRWTELSLDICQDSTLVAASFFRASGPMAPSLNYENLEEWVRLGQRIYRQSGLTENLAARFFEASPRLVRNSSLYHASLLVDILLSLGRWSVDLALEILSFSSRLFQYLDNEALGPFLIEAQGLAEDHVASVRSLFDAGLTTYAVMDRDRRSAFLNAVHLVARKSPQNLVLYLSNASKFQDSFKGESGALIARFSGTLAGMSLPASREFLRHAPAIIERLDLSMVERWCQHGVDLMTSHEAAGLNYFRLESREALDFLYSLTPAVELQEVRDVLRLYCQALMGKSIAIIAAEELAEKGPGWSLVEQIPFEGAAIFAPSRMHQFETKDSNFESYKVLATHQAAHLEFNTYDFSYTKGGAIFPNLRESLAGLVNHDRNFLADFERFFALFPSRRLARDLFAIAEDARIDQKVRTEYRGIRRALRKAQDQAALQRSPIESLPLREAMVETLMLITLEAPGPFYVPEQHLPLMRNAVSILAATSSEKATVEDAAEATIRLYHLMQQISNVPQDEMSAQSIVPLDPGPEEYSTEDEDPEQILSSFGDSGGLEPIDSSEKEYVSIPAPQHRGDLRPEMVQTLFRLQKEAQLNGVQQQGQEFGEDMLQRLLDALGIIENFDTAGDPWIDYGGYEALSPSMLITNLLRALQGKGTDNTGESPVAAALGEGEAQSFRYDEWDYRAKNYRPKWCQVRQRLLKEGAGGFYEQTIYNYQWLVSAVRRQFEMLRPENFSKIKRLPDGEEYDLDAVVEAVVERRAGTASSDKLYWRRVKTERNVAVAVLLDMSLSTDERIEQSLYREVQAIPEEMAGRSFKRIIDVEKESLVLLIEALEQIRDTYGVYGFSGAGKEDVQYYVIKEMEEPFSAETKARIDKITPVQGTRMGPAIRHTISKLENVEAKTKVLILISDGRPQDRDYGSAAWDMDLSAATIARFTENYGAIPSDMFTMDEKDYAVHDTKMALVEARNKEIIPFCISVDKEGHDYMREMCGDIGYEVVGDIESLPRRLPALYRRLTT